MAAPPRQPHAGWGSRRWSCDYSRTTNADGTVAVSVSVAVLLVLVPVPVPVLVLVPVPVPVPVLVLVLKRLLLSAATGITSL